MVVHVGFEPQLNFLEVQVVRLRWTVKLWSCELYMKVFRGY